MSYQSQEPSVQNHEPEPGFTRTDSKLLQTMEVAHELSDQNVIVAYTDGSCHPNPGPGGWGVRLMWCGTSKDIYGGAPNQTNNTMELMAIYEALVHRTRPEVPMVIYADSKYAINAVTKWHRGWAARGWLTTNGEPVKNQHIIKPTIPMVTRNVHIRWVQGHAGHDHNEYVDELANRGRREFGAGSGAGS